MRGVELASAFVSLLPSFRGGAARISSELGGPIAKASAVEGKRSGGIFSSAFGGAIAGAVKGGIFAGAAGLGALGFIGLKTAADLEQAKISFETLLGSGKKADKFLNTLKGFAAKTPFELPGLVGTARQLLGVGASAKSVIPTLTAWGDTAGALGLSQFEFERTMRAVTQTMAKGKIQAEEMMQITEAGVPIWTILSKALKKPIPEIQKLSSEGKLLAKDVWPLVEKQLNKDFGGSMAKQSKTLAGLWSTFMDTLKLGAADALEPIIPLIKDAMPGAMKLLGKALAGIGGILKTTVLSVRALFRAFSGEGITSDGVVGAFEKIGVAGRDVSGTVKGILATFKPLVPVLVKLGKEALAVIVPGFQSVAKVVTSKLLPAIERFLPVVMPVVKFLLNVLGSAVIGALKGAFQVISGVFTAISGLLDIFTGIFTGDWKLFWSGVKNLFAGVWNAILGLIKIGWNVGILRMFRLGFGLLKGLVTKGLSLIVGFFKALPGRLLGALGNLGKLLFTKGLALVRGLLDGVKNYYLNLARFFIGLPARILKNLGSLATVLFDAGKDLIRGLLNGIKAMAGEVANAAKNVVSGAVDAAKHALGLGSPSKIFKQYGIWTLQGFIAGIGKMAGRTGSAVSGALSFDKPGALSTPLAGYRPGRGGSGSGGGNIFNITMYGVSDMREFVEQLQKYVKRNPGLRLDVRTA